MSQTTKSKSDRDGNQTLQYAFNDVDSTISINGFLVGKVGHRITLALSMTTVTDDTETWTFFDGTTQLYQLTLIYTDGTRETLISAERTA